MVGPRKHHMQYDNYIRYLKMMYFKIALAGVGVAEAIGSSMAHINEPYRVFRNRKLFLMLQ